MRKKLAIIIGTRPEGIKMAPIIHCAKEQFGSEIDPIVISTGQHTTLLDDVFSYFNITPDHSIDIDRRQTKLSELQAQLTVKLETLFESIKPDIVMVQGDTLSTFSGAMAAYYQKIPIAYIEAGLRSGNLYAPFPEEANRLMTTQLAKWYFTPTATSTVALKRENITQHVHQVGNTVVDAVTLAKKQGFDAPSAQHEWISTHKSDRKMVLITVHRRESWNSGIDQIIHAVETLASTHHDRMDFVWITHANPELAKKVTALNHHSNIYTYPPVNYPQLLNLMSNATLILTDSGGIQEEAPSLNVPVLVARDVSERMEGVTAGCAKLVGTNPDTIIEAIEALIQNPSLHQKMTGIDNPYGDGYSSQRILKVLTN